MGSLSAEQFFGPLSMGALSDGCRERSRQRGARTLRLTERRDGEALVAARTAPRLPTLTLLELLPGDRGDDRAPLIVSRVPGGLRLARLVPGKRIDSTAEDLRRFALI